MLNTGGASTQDVAFEKNKKIQEELTSLFFDTAGRLAVLPTVRDSLAVPHTSIIKLN